MSTRGREVAYLNWSLGKSGWPIFNELKGTHLYLSLDFGSQVGAENLPSERFCFGSSRHNFPSDSDERSPARYLVPKNQVQTWICQTAQQEFGGS